MLHYLISSPLVVLVLLDYAPAGRQCEDDVIASTVVKLGGRITRESAIMPYGRLIAVDLSSIKTLSRADIELIASCDSITRLNVQHTGLPAASYATIGKMKLLTHLDISDNI